MQTLNGKVSYLTLRRSEEYGKLSIGLFSSKEEVLAQWDWTTRSSPIFHFDDCSYPDWLLADQVYLFFVGPIDPALFDCDLPCYQTLGLFNLVITCFSDQLLIMQEWVGKYPDVAWECWELERGEIVNTGTYGAARGIKAPAPLRAHVPPGLQSAEEENSALFSSSIARADRFAPHLVAELRLFAEKFRAQLEAAHHAESEIVRLSWLVNVNAALSRFTSQTFSGVSPIEATECHFWSHSLLGIGLATQALVNIRKFAQSAVGEDDWMVVLERLGKVPLPDRWVQLFARPPAPPAHWLDTEQIVDRLTASDPSTQVDGAPSNPRLPLIVCYSGRDGFRSTHFSLSAPLEVISSANAYEWSPVTLTHEICHVFVNGIVSTILPDASDSFRIERISQLIDGARPANILEDLQVAFYFCYKLLQREVDELQVDEPDVPRPWLEVVERNSAQVNELLTHILDYQFFYGQDETRYIKSIWASWDVIPNIGERIQSYLVRSSCALLSERISNADAIPATLNRLKGLLEELRGEMVHNNYVDQALRLLDVDYDRLVKLLRYRELLVRLARTFLSSQAIGARIAREHRDPGELYGSLRAFQYSGEQIWNPIRFLGHFCTDRRGDRAKSLWLLTKVAFMRDSDETFA